MEFLKRMKKREFIEMALKTTISILLGIIVIFFMEAMIYHIIFSAIEDKHSYEGNPAKYVYYVVEESNDSYKVYIDADGWASISGTITKAELDAKLEPAGAMYNYNARLYKIVTSNDQTFEYDNATSKSAYSQLVEANITDETITYDVFTRTSEESEYTATPVFDDVSKEEITEMFTKRAGEYYGKKVVYRTPNAFDIYINGTHYVVMFLFLAIIGGVFAWRFTLINKEYNKLERKFKKTGKIFD